MKAATAEAHAASSKASSAFNGLAGVGKVALVASGAAMVGLAGIAMELANRVEASGQAAYDMSEKFGILPGVASAWTAVASQLGVSTDTIGNGFKFLTRNAETMNLQLQASGKITALTAQPWKDLGINVLGTGGHLKDTNELMLEAADSFSKMPDGAEKAALAMKLFGRAGADLIPVLDLGRSGIEKYITQGKAMGAVMSGPQVIAAHNMFLAHKQLDTAIGGVTTQLGIGLMPVATQFFGYASGTAIPTMERLTGWFSKHTTVAKILAGVVGGVLGVAIGAYLIQQGIAITQTTIHTAGIVANTVAKIATAAATGGWTAAQWALNVALDANPIGLIVIAIAALVVGLVLAYNHVGWFRDAVNNAWSGLKAFGSWISSTFGPILGAMGGALKTAGGFLNAINPWAKHSPSLVENVQTGVAAITGHYANMARSVGSSMGAIGGTSGVGAFGTASSSSAGNASSSALGGDPNQFGQQLAAAFAQNLRNIRVVVRIGDKDFSGYLDAKIGTALAG